MSQRERLVQRLRQNWALSNRDQCTTSISDVTDDSLTSLSWLQNLHVMRVSSAVNGRRLTSGLTTSAVTTSTTQAMTTPATRTMMTSMSGGCEAEDTLVKRQKSLSSIVDGQSVRNCMKPQPLLTGQRQQIIVRVKQQHQQQQPSNWSIGINNQQQQEPLQQCDVQRVPRVTISNQGVQQQHQEEEQQQHQPSGRQFSRMLFSNANAIRDMTPNLARIPNTLTDQVTPISRSTPPTKPPTLTPRSTVRTWPCPDDRYPFSGGDTVQRGVCNEVRSEIVVGSLNKPDYSYTALVCMALSEAPRKCATFAEICDWIVGNFPYYTQDDPIWQNLIRHNLSSNKRFQKVTGVRNGELWTINPNFQYLENKVTSMRRHPSIDNHSPPKRSRRALKRHRSPSAGAAARRARTGTTESKAVAGNNAADSILHFGADSLADVLDMSWSSILKQDSDMIDGVLSMTDDFGHEIYDFGSPPPSDNDSLDLAFDAELLQSATELLLTSDAICDGLDLTVQGVGLRPPGWWNDPVGRFPSPPLNEGAEEVLAGLGNSFSCAYEHPWAETTIDLDESLGSINSDISQLAGTI